MQFGSRMGKYFGTSRSSSHQHSPQDDFDQYRAKAEDWVRRNPGAALAIALLAGAMLFSSRGMRKMAIPLGLMALRRWMR